MKKTLLVLSVLALLSSGCAMGAGMVAGSAIGGLVGNSLEAGKTDYSTSCPSCVTLPNGMTRDEYARQLREQKMREMAVQQQ